MWLRGFDRPHKHQPMRPRLLSAGVAEQRLMWRQRQHLAQLDLGFVPLEHQYPLGLQHSETLRKALAQILAPVITELAVFGCQP
jgi:hypothetical protein